jgi:hypothetical protein
MNFRRHRLEEASAISGDSFSLLLKTCLQIPEASFTVLWSCAALQGARGRRTFPLHAESALPGQPADDCGNRCVGQSVGLGLSIGGERAVSLSADFSRRESASAKSGRIVSGLFRSSAALLAFAHAPSTGGKSRAAMGSGVCRRKLRLVLRRGGIMPRHHFNVKLAGIVFLLGFVAHFIAIPLVRKRAKKEQATGPGTADGG